MRTAILTPAYGRDYKSAKDAKADFNADKDFILNDISSPYDGKYINKPQVAEAGYTNVHLRYRRLTEVAIVTVEK